MSSQRNDYPPSQRDSGSAILYAVGQPVVKIRDLLQSPRARKLARFTLVSLISTAFSLFVIGIVYGLRIINSEIGATLLGNVLAIVPSYRLNRRWTWRKTGPSHMRAEIVPFWIVSLLSIGFSVLGAKFATYIVSIHNWSHSVNTVVVLALNLLSFLIVWIVKLFIFNRIFTLRGIGPQDDETHLKDGAQNR